MTSVTPSNDDSGLFFRCHNPEGNSTIILLHGLFSSSNEYSPVVSFIPSQYHLIIPDLPGHSGSAKISLASSSLSSILTHLASLITTHAINGKAHLVGLSFGGYLALGLAAERPELVLSCLATGAVHDFDGYFGTFAPYIAFSTMTPILAIPGFFEWFCRRNGFTVPEGLSNDMWNNITWKNAKAGYGLLATEFSRRPIPARTLLCAGSKGDTLSPLSDQVKFLRDEGGNRDSQAVIAENMEHAWDLQAPELFSKLVVSWVENTEFPLGITKLDDWDFNAKKKRA